MSRKYLLFFLLLSVQQLSFAQSSRSIIDFNNNWKFSLGNDSTSIDVNYNDVKWRTLNLPHDWSIEGAFSATAAATTQGGALSGGIGWYRKIFTVPTSSDNKNLFIEFEGIYRNSEVWINNHYLGKRPNGYISFRYDLTPHLKYGKEKNIIVVKVDNSQQPNSRWYTGSGIYRNVRLVTENKIAFDYGGTFISSSIYNVGHGGILSYYQLKHGMSTVGIVSIASGIHNHTTKLQNITLVHTIYDAAGKKVLIDKSQQIQLDTLGTIVKQDSSLRISNPILWSPNNPYLYKVVSTIYHNGAPVDEITTFTGIRKFDFNREAGFFLNSQHLKIRGVCMHHDLGALGAAFNYRAAERQLEILKSMGCNAIRTSHNPPAPEVLDLCDRMGFLVMDEAFDMWQKKKNKFDYAVDFKDWHQQDLEDMVRRDRNHPSIFMWSIGNEIREQFDSSGIAITKALASTVKKLDPTRPVTSALTELDTVKNFIYQSKALDVIGWNYNHQTYPDFLKKYPGQIFIASETNSAIATRGHYDMPSDTLRIWPAKGQKEQENVNGDWTVSAYDNAIAYWGGTHEATWKTIKKHSFLSGLFVWTGFDYLGEPTPYPWPARSSYFGIVDLAGFPKDVYYMYQSEWTDKPVLHVFPHWNWEKGKLVDVWIYYNNADEVELLLNGKSLGTKKKMNDDLHIMWQVPFEEGTLKAISRKNGKVILIKEIKTAGAAAKIELIADRKTIRADGKDLSFVTARVVDKNGNLVPNANNLIQFSTSTSGKIVGTDNGYQADTTSLKNHSRKAWKGLAMAIVKSSERKENITITATSAGLLPITITLRSIHSLLKK
jgi:beta-galactosidase